MKNIAKWWVSRPKLALQNQVVLRIVQWEPVQYLKNDNENIKRSSAKETSIRAYYLKNFCTNPTAYILFYFR